MSDRASAKEWLIADCLNCGKPFGQEEAWMENCPICFKESKGYKLLKGDLAFACLQEEVHRLRSVKPKKEEAGADTSAERLREEVQKLLSECARMSTELEKADRRRQKFRSKISALEGEIERLRHEVSLRSAPVEGSELPLDLPLFRKMLHLCHPDKNPNNVAHATEVTKWLLAQKSKLNL